MKRIFLRRTNITIAAQKFRANTFKKALPKIRSKICSTLRFKFVRLQLGEFPPFRFKINLRRVAVQVPSKRFATLRFKFVRLQLGEFPPFRFKVNLRRVAVQVPSRRFTALKFKFTRLKTEVIPSFRFQVSRQRALPKVQSRIFLLSGLRRSYINSSYLLFDWFGANASQDEEFIYIRKVDFESLALVEQTSLSLFLFSLIQLWIQSEKPGRFNVDLYRNIQFIEENQNYLKEAYLVKLLSNYNGLIFPSPQDLR